MGDIIVWIIIGLVVVFILWRIVTARYRIRRKMLALEELYKTKGRDALTHDELRFIGREEDDK